MESLLLTGRLLLAALFVVAGIAKFADRTGSLEAIVELGIPRRIAVPIVTLLPLAELAIGIALVPNRWLGQVASVWPMPASYAIGRG